MSGFPALLHSKLFNNDLGFPGSKWLLCLALHFKHTNNAASTLQPVSGSYSLLCFKPVDANLSLNFSESESLPCITAFEAC